MLNYIGARIHRGIARYNLDGSIDYDQDPYLPDGRQVRDLPTRWANGPGGVFSFMPETQTPDWRNLDTLLDGIDIDLLGGAVKSAPSFVAKSGFHYRPAQIDSVDYWTLIGATQAAGQRLKLYPEPVLRLVELCAGDDPRAFEHSEPKLFGWCRPNGPTGDIFVRVGDDVSMAQAVVTIGHECWHMNQDENTDHQSDGIENACETFGVNFAQSLGF